jgi:hypothetical protein
MRVEILEEHYERTANHVELWSATSERESCQEVEREDGTVGRCEWNGILTRELERVILGQRERHKYIYLMRDGVLRMDPNFEWAQRKTREATSQCCRMDD